MHRWLDRLCLPLIAGAVVSNLCGCGKPATSDSARKGQARDSQPAISKRSSPATSSQRPTGASGTADSRAWLEAAREDPDPRVRLHAIETWAINPGKSLDPVTYALVDPDETVRARAQELFEDALVRK